MVPTRPPEPNPRPVQRALDLVALGRRAGGGLGTAARRLRRAAWLVRWAACPLLGAASAAAQSWDDPATLALVDRAIARRLATQPDSTLQSYRTTARGFVLFLAQVGERLEGPPRLIKADQLEVEVYWRAPGTSKQHIRAWRDGRWLPTEITYHRDHLGIVTSNFGPLIRIGEGDEVRDVVHPLSPRGRGLYEFQPADSVRLQSRTGDVVIANIRVRPRDPRRPGVIGILGLEVQSAELVRFSFSFTPASYLDASLEDISIGLENARFEQRYWLPWRQEIEIRRRVAWLDFPARSIIRGRWEIGDYEFGVEIPPGILAGPPIGGLLAPAESLSVWEGPLAAVIPDVARPIEERDLDRVRAEVSRIAAGRGLSGLPPVRVGFGALSDLVRVNRVEGLTLGLGASFRAGAVAVRPSLSFGTADERLSGGLGLRREWGGTALTLHASRRLPDVADRPVLSRLANSILAQEGGRDYGDYVLLDRLALGVERRLAPATALGAALGLERSRSVVTEAEPARGRYRANPPLGAGTLGFARVDLSHRAERADRRAGVEARLGAEGAVGDRAYLRGAGWLDWTGPTGSATAIRVELQAGAATARLPGYRSFAIGGWGTLPGERFRAWGGRAFVLGHLEWRVDAPFPAVPLGPFASTGQTVTLAPFVGAGWSGGAVPGVPWRPSDGVRPVAGLAVEWFLHLFRLEAGVSLRTGRLGVSLDVSREWWEVL